MRLTAKRTSQKHFGKIRKIARKKDTAQNSILPARTKTAKYRYYTATSAIALFALRPCAVNIHIFQSDIG